MATTMEPIIKRWYEHMNEGKLMGMKCADCGSYEFPPVPVCNNCGSFNMDWAEVSGEGELFAYNLNATGIFPYSTDVSVSGYCTLKEGMNFIGVIDGCGVADQPALFEKLKANGGKLPIKLKLAPLNEDWKYPVIVLDD